MPLYANIQARARVAKARADLRILSSASAVYSSHVGTLPANLNNLTIVTTVNGVAVGPFVKRLPIKPNATWTNYTYTRLTRGGVQDYDAVRRGRGDDHRSVARLRRSAAGREGFLDALREPLHGEVRL